MKSLSNRLLRAAATGVVGLGVAFTALGVTTNASQAATLIVVGGQLTGATGVNLGALGFFDVTFVDGTCISAFGGCDAVSDFDFDNQTAALTAGQALLDQVFLDSGAGNFDSSPQLIAGCADLSSNSCNTLIPYGLQQGFALPTTTKNSEVEAEDAVTIFGTLQIFADLSTLKGGNFAAFAPSAVVVPLPAALPLFGTGLGILGFLGWRRRRKPAAAV